MQTILDGCHHLSSLAGGGHISTAQASLERFECAGNATSYRPTAGVSSHADTDSIVTSLGKANLDPFSSQLSTTK